MSSIKLPALQDRSLNTYIEEVNKFPMLEEKEEYMLAVRFKEHGDIKAAQKLVTSHLRLVVKIAMMFRGYGLPIADVISEGNIGLMQAVKKFEPSKGFRLSTYAMWWIKAAIHEYVLKSWSIVKVGTSAAQKKLFYNLKRMKNKLTLDSSSNNLTDDNVSEIADSLDVTTAEVNQMDQLMSGGAGGKSLNVAMYDEGDEDQINFLEDTSPTHDVVYAENEELDYNKKILYKAIDTLTEREKEVITKRRLIDNPLTLEDLSSIYKVSRERIRQIENRALEKLQAYMRKAVAA